MGVIVHKEQDKNTDLSDRITADLRVRARQTTEISDPDLAEDIEYVKNFKKTSKFGWIWFVLVAAVLLFLILIIVN